MALSPSTKQCIALNTYGPAGIIYTGLQVGTPFANKTITSYSKSGSGLNYTTYANAIDTTVLNLSIGSTTLIGPS